MITGEALVVCFAAYGCTMGARQVGKASVAGRRGGRVMADEERPARLSGGQRLAVGVSVLLGLCLAIYGVAGSYNTVSILAERKGVPLARLVPVGIDGGLIAVVVLDLVLSWIGQPIGWLRQLVRALTVGTVAANAAAGWPDLVSAGLHAAAPLMLLAMVEAGRTVLLRRIGGLAGQARDPIPAARWLLAPWSTWLMWRRMVLWQEGGFHAALDAEQERRRVVVLLRARYGRRWRRHAPADLAWMPRPGATVPGVATGGLCVAPMAESDIGQGAAGGESEAPGSDMSEDQRRVANGHVASGGVGHAPSTVRPRPSMSRDATHVRKSAPALKDRRDPLIEAGLLLAGQPDMTGADLGRELGVSPRHGLRLKKQIRSSAAR